MEKGLLSVGFDPSTLLCAVNTLSPPVRSRSFLYAQFMLFFSSPIITNSQQEHICKSRGTVRKMCAHRTGLHIFFSTSHGVCICSNVSQPITFYTHRTASSGEGNKIFISDMQHSTACLMEMSRQLVGQVIFLCETRG